MSVFNNAQQAINNANMSETEVSAFNSKFLSYEGTNVRGTNVNSLLNTIRQHNLSVGDDVSKQVKVSVSDGVTSPSGSSSFSEAVLTTSLKVGSGYSFNVVCTPEEGSGLITTITITKR